MAGRPKASAAAADIEASLPAVGFRFNRKVGIAEVTFCWQARGWSASKNDWKVRKPLVRATEGDSVYV